MPGFFGYYGLDSINLDLATAIETIDPAGLCESRAFNSARGTCAVSWLKNSPVLAGKYLENDRFTACFAGDLTGFSDIPWGEITEILEEREFSRFANFRGAFALSIYDKNKNTISVISDRISQQPVYYSESGSIFIFSTALPFFCRFPRDFTFNEKWLWELLFFNYPVGGTTYVENVFKMPPASILEFDLNTSRQKIISYAEPFKRTSNPLKGVEAITEADSVFERRVPEYFDVAERATVSITGGFDSRTILSYAPLERIDTYTYGIEGSGDLKEGVEIASQAGLNHHSIEFGKDFLEELPDLMEYTIYLSGGMERVVRSTLPYVYRELTANGTRYPVIITGISGDHLFRDHIMGTGNIPSLITPDMMAVFHTGNVDLDNDLYRKMFGERYPDYTRYITTALEQLTSRYGDLNTPEAFLSYLIYEVTPHYFAGEAEIAKNFGTFRSPFWDADIIQLSYDIEYSTLGFSKSLPFKDKYRECLLQASIMQKNKSLSHIPINGIPLRFYSADNKLYYNLGRMILRTPGKIKSMLSKSAHTAPEDWRRWFEIVLEEKINNLITEESFITEYLDWKFIEEIKRSKDTHWLGKILTAELVLRLFNRGWKI